ncbi:MAG: ABC transporter permease [Muribaculaceae bacterium]|nr:ABC transporter permease [Muribaculaceae bacterium]
MNAALYISRRLSLKRNTPGEQRSPAVTIAIIGIAIAVAVMMLTLSVVPGFKNEITRKVMSFDAQLTAQPLLPLTLDNPAASAVRLSPDLAELIATDMPDANATLNIQLPGILKTAEHFDGLVFQAYSNPATLDYIAVDMISGSIPDYTCDSTRYDIVISRHTARLLDIDTGDRIDGYFFANDNLRARKFTIAGIYDSHFNDFDRLTCFMSYPAASRLADFDENEGTTIQIRGLDSDELIEARRRLSSIFSDAFHSGITSQYLEVTDVYQQNPMYFNWLDLLDTNVTVIIVLMAIVGSVTLISCLFIIILERIKLIGTLKALGTTDSMLRQIFLYMAERIVIRGIVIGDIIALILITLQYYLRLLPLDPESYYLSSVPVEYNWLGFLTLSIAAAIIALSVMIVPVLTISRIAPARVMRFE